MAKLIKNRKQLEKAMGQLLKDALADTSYMVEEVVDQFLAKWYGDFTPLQYERTEQFLYSCVTSKVIKRGDNYSTTIFIDWKNMHHTKKVKLNRGKEKEVPLKKSEEKLIVEYANEGLHGIESTFEGRTPIRFWDDALSEMEQKDIIINAFYNYLKSEGFSVQFKQGNLYEF